MDYKNIKYLRLYQNNNEENTIYYNMHRYCMCDMDFENSYSFMLRRYIYRLRKQQNDFNHRDNPLFNNTNPQWGDSL